MSATLTSKHYLQRSWESYDVPNDSKPEMTLADKLSKTTSASTLTHVRMPDGAVLKPQQLLPTYGFTYLQWTLMRQSLDKLPVRPETEYCRLGGVALTLDAFEAGHEHIELGRE